MGGARGGTETHGRRRMRDTLVIIETALAVAEESTTKPISEHRSKLSGPAPKPDEPKTSRPTTRDSGSERWFASLRNRQQ
jgi:hypothetical protein